MIVGVIGIVAFGSINSGLATETDAAHLSHLWRRGGWLGFFFFMAFSLALLLLFTSKLDALLASRSEINAAPFSGIAIPPTTTAGPRREGQELSLWQKVAGIGSTLRGYWDSAMVKVGEWLELWTASKDDKQIAWTLGIGWACCGGGLAGGCLVFAKASYVASSFEPSNAYLDDSRTLVFNSSQAHFRMRTLATSSGTHQASSRLYF